jgi:ABC-type sugar transport system ATPase subunit
VLLLDEATSSLDPATEAVIDEHLSQLGCTRVVISHRPHTVRNADLILVLRDGEIVERGTHEELVARPGVYAALMRSRPASAGSTPGIGGGEPQPSVGEVAAWLAGQAHDRPAGDGLAPAPSRSGGTDPPYGGQLALPVGQRR